jgi:hypothetical protein
MQQPEGRLDRAPRDSALGIVKLQILLKRPLMPADGVALEERLAKFGIEVTGRGGVTLSGVIPRDRFEDTFGHRFAGGGRFRHKP